MKFLIPIFFILIILSCADNISVDPEDKGGNIRIGVVLSRSGKYSNYGLSSESAVQLAIKNLTDKYAHKNYTFEILMGETSSDPNRVLVLIDSLYQLGVRHFVCPLSNEELEKISNYTNAKDILMILPRLSISGFSSVNTFSLIPENEKFISTLSRHIRDSGIKSVIVFSRSDIGGEKTSESFTNKFTYDGGESLATVYFEENKEDYSYELDKLDDWIQDRMDIFADPKKIGVLFIGSVNPFGLLDQASEFQWLSLVKWYSLSSYDFHYSIVKNENAAKFAESVGLTNLLFIPDPGFQSEWEPISGYIESNSGVNADPFSLNTYDAINLLIESRISLGLNASLDSVIEQIRTNTKNHISITGSIEFDDQGFRKNSYISFLRLENNSGNYSWITIKNQLIN